MPNHVRIVAQYSVICPNWPSDKTAGDVIWPRICDLKLSNHRRNWVRDLSAARSRAHGGEGEHFARRLPLNPI
eukprot:3656678-Pleurochrysis_carterae.AAC.2